MKFKKPGFSKYASFVAIALLASCATQPKQAPAPAVTEYRYPIENPYAATIIGLPAELKQTPAAPIEVKEEHLTLFKDRKIPEGFWYEQELRYGTILHKKPAPLLYIIAGTGSDHRSSNMVALGQVFYQAGYHVVLLPSSTHPNFIITASETFVPGRLTQSAEDMYRVIKRIDADIAKKNRVQDRFLMGYSLGALDSAFTAHLDDQEKAINFKRVLLINPPLSLYSAIQKVDRMLYQGLPDGINGVDKFIDTEMARLSTASPSGDPLDFSNSRLLIDAYTKYPVSDERLASMIGLAFRLFSANMIFTSDVMTHKGYIFPSNVPYRTTTHMNDYLSVALRTSLMNYFEDVYSEYYLSADPTLTPETLVSQSSLEYLAPYLQNNPKFGLFTNKDDIILSKGDLERLQHIFGSRARVYPNGGHLGNLNYAPVTQDMVQFMNGGAK